MVVMVAMVVVVVAAAVVVVRGRQRWVYGQPTAGELVGVAHSCGE